MSRSGLGMTDSIFEELKSALIDQQRLLKRFYDFCLAYQDFEFDEMGLNIDDAQNEKRKALKIKDKLIEELNISLKMSIEATFTDTLKNSINLLVIFNINESKKSVEFVLSVEENSFTLEEKEQN
jgi:hypothetical protein